MWIVRLALSRPYTFIVFALLLLILGLFTILRTPKDIFPSINIPVVSVVWTYSGLRPIEMSGRITYPFERALPTTVNNIEHIESQSLIGVSVTKVFFHASVDIAVALSQVTAISQTMLRPLPPGTLPPLILSYSAFTVPVIQMVLSSDTLLEQQLFDLGNSFIRTQLAPVEGASIPYPYGGKVRQVQVDLDPVAMQNYQVSAEEVNRAIGEQNLIIPAGTEKIGLYEYFVALNASPKKIEEFNDFPIRKEPNNIVYIHDIGHVRDGFAPQTNIVRVNGKRAVLMPIQKTGNSSTLDIIQKVKNLMPQIKASMPKALNIQLIADQSLFVKAAINGVVREAVLAAFLTGLMIYLFVGSFLSTLIIAISIPLSILASIILFASFGQTINIMTLGGLALAVGILVDDATVTIENINWHLERGKPLTEAILDGAKQIALPALVSTLCICIVFVPVFFFQGISYYLFSPLSLAVIFAMLASYFLSRTLVPTLASYWLGKPLHQMAANSEKKGISQLQSRFEARFMQFREHYHQALIDVLENKIVFIIIFVIFVTLTLLIIFPGIGSDFFPKVDAGQIKLHIQAPTGTRVEETARLCGRIDTLIRELIPKDELDTIVDNIGLPTSGINLSYSNSAPIGPASADIYISLKAKHKPTEDYIDKIRKELLANFPQVNFSFLPADMVGQILNFGLPSQIDIQVVGLKEENNRAFINHLLKAVKKVPGIVDAHIHQAFNYPQFKVSADRSFAKELGITEANIASDLLISLSGSFQTSPTFWLNPENAVSYSVVTQTPQYKMDSLQTLENTLITGTEQAQILGSLARIERGVSPAVISHFNVQPVLDIFASVEGRDLGSVAKELNRLIHQFSKDLPRGSSVSVHGQIETQNQSFKALYAGLVFAIILIYLLIVVNFQSWMAPFVIIMALPGGIAGICWMLFITHTTLSVPALMGTIMTIGVATANSILMISFCLEGLREGLSPYEATLRAGVTRLRPIVMTALAMIIGMLPMALALGEGAEQNAPLGRAVIGGLLFATVATLFFVPSVFCYIYERRNRAPLEGKMA